MVTILIFLVVLSILVFVHEFGHFIVAKWVGVRVERFSVGFGPAIYKKTYGETEYQIACIPLGGYVKMSGEDPSEELEEGEKEDPEESRLPPCPPERMFNNQNLSGRLAIVLAGPLMNIFMAFLLVPLVYMMGIEVDATLYSTPIVGFVDPDGPAQKTGFLKDDLIVSINDKEMETWKDVKTFILFHPNRDLTVDLKRGEEMKTLHVKTDTLPSIGGGSIGIFPEWPSKIKKVIEGKPAQIAGLNDGDLITKIDQIETPHWFQTQQYIQKNPDKEIQVTVERGQESLTVTVIPKRHEEYKDLGFIGIEPVQASLFRRFGFFKSIQLGFQENIENTLTTFVVVGKLFSGDLKIKAMGGPVQIAEFTGAAAQEGLSHLLLFMGFISLQLAILNLLPIPVLDGGHVLFMLIEAIKGSPLSTKKRLVAQQVGMVLLLTLMVVVTFNDVARHKSSIFGFFKNLLP